MAGTRVTHGPSRTPSRAGRIVMQFEAKVGALYLTPSGRVAQLKRVKPDADGRDLVLLFHYVGVDGQTEMRGPVADSVEITEGMAAQILKRLA